MRKVIELLRKLLVCERENVIFNVDKSISSEDIAEVLLELINCKVNIEFTLRWMTTAMKWREDDLRNNLEDNTEGGYSDELLKAIKLCEEIKEGE